MNKWLISFGIVIVLFTIVIFFNNNSKESKENKNIKENKEIKDIDMPKPVPITIDNKGYIYLVRSENDEQKLYKLSPNKEVLKKLTLKTKFISDIKIDYKGNIYLSTSEYIEKYSSNGDFIQLIGNDKSNLEKNLGIKYSIDAFYITSNKLTIIRHYSGSNNFYGIKLSEFNFDGKLINDVGIDKLLGDFNVISKVFVTNEKNIILGDNSTGYAIFNDKFLFLRNIPMEEDFYPITISLFEKDSFLILFQSKNKNKLNYKINQYDLNGNLIVSKQVKSKDIISGLIEEMATYKGKVYFSLYGLKYIYEYNFESGNITNKITIK